MSSPSAATRAFRETLCGFECAVLRSDALEVRIVPEIGAKITHLTALAGGREWLWRPPGEERLFRSPTGAAFASGTLWGLDECFPTIAPCRWRGRELPDHGEAWTEAWAVDEADLQRNRITTRLRLPISPLALERTATVDGPRLRLRYAVTNIGAGPYEYLWALHPLFALQPGDRLRLPEEIRRVTTFLAINAPLGNAGDEWDWPAPAEGIRPDAFDLGKGDSAVKFFTPPLRCGEAAIENIRTGDFLRLGFSTTELNTLGVWINRGGWGGYHHAAIEPTNGAPDPLDAAVNGWRRFSRLDPGETRRWEIWIEVGHGPIGASGLFRD